MFSKSISQVSKYINGILFCILNFNILEALIKDDCYRSTRPVAWPRCSFVRIQLFIYGSCINLPNERWSSHPRVWKRSQTYLLQHCVFSVFFRWVGISLLPCARKMYRWSKNKTRGTIVEIQSEWLNDQYDHVYVSTITLTYQNDDFWTLSNVKNSTQSFKKWWFFQRHRWEDDKYIVEFFDSSINFHR